MSTCDQIVGRLLEYDEDAKDFLMGVPLPETPHETIHRVYGTLDFLTVSVEAAKKRAGTPHHERCTIPAIGICHCRVCGSVTFGIADPEFHPEVYL